MSQYKCAICGYVAEGDAPPDACPLCGVGPEHFLSVEPAVSAAVPVDPPGVPGEAGDDAGSLRRWRCVVCGEEFVSREKPALCPVCGVGPEAIEPVDEPDGGIAPTGDTSGPAGRYVLIGGGVASFEAAKALRKLCPAASITLLCDESLPPYNRPGLSDLIEEDFPPDKLLLGEPGRYEALGVDLRIGAKTVRIDRYARMVYLADGAFLPYDKLLLATGSNSFNPIGAPAGAVPVLALRRYEDARAILAQCGAGRRAVVVGGGILGVELAVALRARGVAVTVVELSDRLLALQADPPASEQVRRALADMGVEARTGDCVAAVTAEGVTLKSGDRIACDFVCVSAGVRAETSLAADCGLTVGRGVVVDGQLRTSDPAIFAAGDCAELDGRCGGLWATAMAQGKAAAAAMTGAPAAYRPAVPATSLVLGAFKLFSAGTLNGDEVLRRETADGSAALYLCGGKLVGAVLVGDVSLTGKLLKGIEAGAPASLLI